MFLLEEEKTLNHMHVTSVDWEWGGGSRQG